MYSKEDRIPTSKETIIILGSICLLSGMLTILGVEGKPPIRVSPEFLLISSIVFLLNELKMAKLSNDVITIRQLMLFYERRIPWHRVNNVMFVSNNHIFRILFCLDDCEPFEKYGNKKVERYIIMHPFKVVSIRIQEKDFQTCVKIINKYREDVLYFGCSSTLD